METSTEKFEILSYRELQKAAKCRGIKAAGKRVDILRRLRQNEDAAPTSKTSSSLHRSPSGKENDTHVVPRKTRTMASSGASPHLLKKALGQISLNSPRLNHRIVPRKKKPLFSPAAAATAATAAAKEARAHDTEHVAATEASSAPSPAPGVEASQLVSPRRSGVAMKDKDSASNERTSAKATSMDGEVRSPSAAEVRGRPSMMAVTANPRLQEVSALPSGTVVRVKLFSEDAGEERLQETLKEKPAAAVADATIDKEVGASVAAMAPALAADVAGLSVCTKVAEQQHQQEKGDGGDVDEALAKDLSRAIQSSLQLQDNTPLADYQHDQTVLGAVENDMVEEASTSTVAVPPMGSTIGNDQGHEMVASTQGHEKNEKARVAAEDQDRQQRKIESAMTETGAGVVTVAENENVTIVEKEQEHNLEGDASATLPQAEKEGDVVLISPTQGKCDVISMSPSPLNKEDGIVRISPPEEAAVVTNGPAEVIVEGGAGAGAPGVRRAAAANERDEGSLVNSDMAQHSGLVVDAETETLVEKSKYLHFEEDERIVRCTLTGKKLAPDYVGILNYITSRKVQQLMVEGQFFMSDYEGMFLVEDPDDQGFVFCELTGMRMFKSKAAVDQHVNGEPFQEMMALVRDKFAV